MSTLMGFAHWFNHYGIAFMVLIFLGIFITTYWPSRKSTIEQNGLIPFLEDEANTESSRKTGVPS